jgi:hypothetical protein
VGCRGPRELHIGIRTAFFWGSHTRPVASLRTWYAYLGPYNSIGFLLLLAGRQHNLDEPQSLWPGSITTRVPSWYPPTCRDYSMLTRQWLLGTGPIRNRAMQGRDEVGTTARGIASDGVYHSANSAALDHVIRRRTPRLFRTSPSFLI